MQGLVVVLALAAVLAPLFVAALMAWYAVSQ